MPKKIGEKGELPIPPAALSDPNGRQMIRTWAAAKGLHCTLNVGMWHGTHVADEPYAWGMLLADVVRHVANALDERFGMNPSETIKRIRHGFQIELDHPTSQAQGNFVEPNK